MRLIAGADGWARPESSYQDLANVAVCSIVLGPDDFDQATWRLELRLSDSDGRTAETTVRIQPRCDADSDLLGCECACDAERPAGGECPTDPIDAGVDAGPPDAAPTDAS